VTDNDGATDTDDKTVTVNAAPVVNQPPVANAGNNIVLTLPVNSTTLTGTATDADGTIASYAWTRVSGPTTFTIGNANAATTTLTNLVQGTYVFRLTVTDNGGATDTDDKTVTVNAAPVVNQPPLANAGNNVVLTLPTNSTTLTGSGTDADGTIAGYAWTRVSGPTTFTLGTPNAATTTLTNLVEGTYVFRLTVTDNDGATDTDNKTVTVNAAQVINQPPLANAGNNVVLTLPTNSTTLAGTGTDADGTIAGYAWTMVSGPTIFTIGNANAATTTLTGLVQGTYTFRLTVTDNDGATDTDNKTVTVNAAPVVNQVPVANAGNNIVLTLPTNSTNLTGTGTDADGTIASYMWTRVSGPTTFTLGNANAATTTLTNLVQGTYVFRLTVTDNGGATATDDKTVTVNAAPIPNQAPVANAGNNIVLTLPTNSTNLVGTGTDADGTITSYVWTRVSGPATFTLGSANAATTTLTNLVQGTYVFRLTVTDNRGATATDDKTVTVNAVPNQAPIANAGVSQAITLSSNEATLNGSLSRDPDGTIKSYKWEQISGPSNATIASLSLVKTKVTGFIEGDYIFQLTVTDNLNATAKDTITIAVVNNFRSFTGDMMLYPNPASNQITLNLYNEKYSKAEISIYDVMGRKVMAPIQVSGLQSRFTKSIETDQLKPGTYLIEVILDNREKITSKFIKL
ncbi:MAG: PKD domain-containing protein, partial [Chitinophagaceae bacterium]